MRVLLVNPEFPNSYWSGRSALEFAGRRSLLPPLGLITVAALLPDNWDCRLVDLNIEPLGDADLEAADLVMLTGMLVQRPSLHEVLARCRRLGVRTVVGGPYATALPDELEAADHVVTGEVEEILPSIAAELAAGRAQHLYSEQEKPDLTAAPMPRYDLLKVEAYHQMALQFSRGCPFNCEFCDIIVMYGRKPRTKTSRQVITELEAIVKTGFRGDVFFVDDNFIGNKPAVKAMLPEISDWRRKNSPPLDFYTVASMNLADDDVLVDLMTHAGFTAVFIGIETPSAEALKETRKLQNLRRNMVDQVHFLLDRGLDVWAGFILGFDNDGPDSFDRMIDFVRDAAIPYAMVGMLSALPNTPLYRRLEREGRLRPDTPGDQFRLTNVETKLPADLMVAGYRRVLETLYHPEVFFNRCRENLARWKPNLEMRRPVFARDLWTALRAIRGQGLGGHYRKAYWSFLGWVLRHHPEKIGRALAQAAAGHHYITYTRQVVVPTLKETTRRLSSAPAPADLTRAEPALS
jgi:radical SAM superfamily enzyme YgiQ (UPF0313 family)